MNDDTPQSESMVGGPASSRYFQDLSNPAKSGKRPALVSDEALESAAIVTCAQTGGITLPALVNWMTANFPVAHEDAHLIVAKAVQHRKLKIVGDHVVLVPPRRRLTTAWFRPFAWFIFAVLGTLVLLLAFCAKANAVEVTSAVFRPEQTPALPAGEWLTVEATAYCPCSKCTDGDRITANGTKTGKVPYAIAADQSLPMGSRVFIPAGLGYLDRLRPTDRIFSVDDRGGALDTEALRSGVFRIDLRFKDHADAQRFGRKMVAVFLFSPTSH